MTLAPGPAAGVATLPWLVVGLVHAVSAAVDLAPVDVEPRRPSAWIVADRLDLRPGGFDPTTVRLTAVHFHFAGFGLLTIAGRLIDGGGLVPRVAAASVAIGVPLVATGFLGFPVAGLAGVVGVASGGVLVGLVQLAAAGAMRSRMAQWLARVGGFSLLVTMPMAVLWQLGQVLPMTAIDMTAMVRVHGVLNALGFAVASMVAWTLDRSGAVARSPIAVAAL